jgi:hypothetical protein
MRAACFNETIKVFTLLAAMHTQLWCDENWATWPISKTARKLNFPIFNLCDLLNQQSQAKIDLLIGVAHGKLSN